MHCFRLVANDLHSTYGLIASVIRLDESIGSVYNKSSYKTPIRKIADSLCFPLKAFEVSHPSNAEYPSKVK